MAGGGARGTVSSLGGRISRNSGQWISSFRVRLNPLAQQAIAPGKAAPGARSRPRMAMGKAGPCFPFNTDQKTKTVLLATPFSLYNP